MSDVAREELSALVQLKWWLGICCLVGAMGGLVEWWLLLNPLQFAPLGLTVVLIAAPLAVLIMLAGYAVVGETQRQDAMLIGPVVALLGGAIAWLCYLS